jgi:hypothetical protein
VDKEIQTTQCFYGFIDDAMAIWLASDITHNDEPGSFTDSSNSLLEARLSPGRQGDPTAGAERMLGDGSADA